MEAQTSESEPRRNRRLRLACARCQRRKIRCDGQFPTCNNCKKASATCSDGDSLRLRDLPREDKLVARLRDRIATLEAALRERNGDANPHRVEDDQVLSSPSQHAVGAAARRTDGANTPEESFLSAPGAVPATASGLMSQVSAASGNLGNDNALSHEIGLVSVGNSTAPRYIGPSSGYFLSRMLLSSSSSFRRSKDKENVGDKDGTLSSSRLGLALDLIGPAQPAATPPDQARAHQLCNAYFHTVAPQYPILHRPSFMHVLDGLYASEVWDDQQDDVAVFQAYMVLAIGSTILSHQLKVPLPANAYCMAAFERLERLKVENSLPGLQCLLLLLVFTIHSPHVRLNAWYLNYQCIAAVLDMGLQRNITTSNGISLLEQEMRTRIFWVVFSLDRTIATIMGRPIGLRDEACELRYPKLIEDDVLSGAVLTSAESLEAENTYTGPMEFSLHLFKLARLNSQIKYVANSITRDTPSYAYPAIADIQEWQKDMALQLDDWAQQIPKLKHENSYMTSTCELRYHSLMMLLMRPSPAIPSPSTESLHRCYVSCQSCLHVFNRMYRDDLLVFSWTSFHSILSSVITMLYCVRASPTLARNVEPHTLLGDAYTGLSILSAAGEHWPGAKRSRNVLDDLVRDVVRWTKEIRKSQERQGEAQDNQQSETTVSMPGSGSNVAVAPANFQELGLGYGYTGTGTFGASDSDFPYVGHQDLAMTGVIDNWWTDPLGGQFSLADPASIDTLMHSFFTDFSPNADMF